MTSSSMSIPRRRTNRNGNALPTFRCRAVAYIVLSSRDEASYDKGAPALQEVLKTLVYLEPKDESKPR